MPIGPRTAAVLVLASVAGLMMLCWPLLLVAQPGERVEPPFLFLVLLPLVVVVVLAEMGEGGMDSRVLAVLGVLSAINAVMRGLGAGTAGIELVFFLLVLGGRVFGAGFGFVLGCTSLFASALLTAGVGPWLPFQMICAAWVGMGAGLLPRRVGGRAEIAMLVAYAVVASYLYGLLMNLSSWPFTLGIVVPGHEGSLAYVAGRAGARERPPVPRLHAADLDRRLGHRPRDHDRRSRSSSSDRRSSPRCAGRPVARSYAPAERALPAQGRTRMIRSSAGVGSPRPSWLDVVSHRRPSGAVTTVRSRP